MKTRLDLIEIISRKCVLSITYLDGVIGVRFSPIVFMTRLPHTAKPTMIPAPP